MGRSRVFLIAGVIIVVGAVAGAAVYFDQIAPLRTVVVTVGKSVVRMRTFLIRMHMSGREPAEMLQLLAREEIVKRAAPYPPYNIVVAEADVDAYLKEVARGKSESIGDKDYKEWYRQQVNESRFSDREFRDLARTKLLVRRLGDALAERVPTVAEQVHLFMIPTKGLEAARAVRKRLQDGEDFSRLAREHAVDHDGDTGWHPRGGLVPHLAAAAFDELAIGEVSEPLFLDGEMFAVVMVSGRAAARELDEAAWRRLQERALDDWLQDQEKSYEVGFYGFKGGYDSETDAWVRWQLARMRK